MIQLVVPEPTNHDGKLLRNNNSAKILISFQEHFLLITALLSAMAAPSLLLAPKPSTPFEAILEELRQKLSVDQLSELAKLL